MDIIINNNHIIKALKEPSRVERCGLIVGKHDDADTIRVMRLMHLPNCHPEPADNFRINKVQVKRALRVTTFAPLGYWHTHNDNHSVEPSPADLLQMGKYPRFIGMVYHVPTGTLTWFNHQSIIKQEVIY